MRQWLEDLPEPHKSKAINNLDESHNGPCPDIQEALCRAFYWTGSTEGLTYWSDVYKSLNA